MITPASMISCLELFPRGSRSGIIYGMSKVHKTLINNFPKLGPMLSAINTATYGWAKFFVPLRKYFTMNEYTLKNAINSYYCLLKNGNFSIKKAVTK